MDSMCGQWKYIYLANSEILYVLVIHIGKSSYSHKLQQFAPQDGRWLRLSKLIEGPNDTRGGSNFPTTLT